MPRVSDLVRDSSLNTEFRDSITVHSYREINEAGHRFLREEHWESGRVLGRGGFGQVRLQKCVAGAKQNSLRAVKVVNKPSNTSGTLSLNRELEAIVKFSNDRYRRWFVKSFGWYEDPTSIFITMEYCHYGDLHHYLIKKSPVPAEEVQQLAYQILEGLDQMHQNEFAHRDLKPGNILIKSMPPEERWWVVLADFGISKKADESNGPTTTIHGTIPFMAPELLECLDQIRPRSIADFKAADMWALGEILFQMLTSEATFRGLRDLDKYCTGQKQFPSDRLPTSITDEGRDFITSIMVALPQERRNTTQCIQHRWMELLRVEEELTTLSLEQNSPQQTSLPMSETSSNGPASARWTSPSDLQDEIATQATAQGRTEMPLHLNHPSAAHTQLQSTPNDISIRLNPKYDRFSTTLGEIAQVKKLTGLMKNVCRVIFSPDNRWIAMAFNSYGKTQLWSAESGTLIHEWTYYCNCYGDNYPRHFAFSPDSRRLIIVCGKADTLHLGSVESGTLISVIENRETSGSAYTYLAASPDNRWLIIRANNERSISLWSTETRTVVEKLTYYAYHTIIEFSANGRWLAIASREGPAPQLWSTESIRLVQKLEICLDSDPNGVRHMSFSPDSRWLSITTYTTMWLWSAESGMLKMMHTGISSLHGPTFSPDSRWIAASVHTHTDTTVRLWSTESKKQELVLGDQDQSEIRSLVLSPDSKWLAFIPCDISSTSTLWFTRSGMLVRMLKNYHSDKSSPRVNHWAFSPDSKWLAICFVDVVQLYSDESATVIGGPESCAGTYRLTFSPDSRWLAITHRSGVHLWSTKHEILVEAPLKFDSEGYYCAAFSPDSRRMVTASGGDTTAQLWSIDGE